MTARGPRVRAPCRRLRRLRHEPASSREGASGWRATRGDERPAPPSPRHPRPSRATTRARTPSGGTARAGRGHPATSPRAWSSEEPAPSSAGQLCEVPRPRTPPRRRARAC